MENTTVKDFENQPTFVKVTNGCIAAQFFLTHCIYIIAATRPVSTSIGARADELLVGR